MTQTLSYTRYFTSSSSPFAAVFFWLIFVTPSLHMFTPKTNDEFTIYKPIKLLLRNEKRSKKRASERQREKHTMELDIDLEKQAVINSFCYLIIRCERHCSVSFWLFQLFHFSLRPMYRLFLKLRCISVKQLKMCDTKLNYGKYACFFVQNLFNCSPVYVRVRVETLLAHFENISLDLIRQKKVACEQKFQ